MWKKYTYLHIVDIRMQFVTTAINKERSFGLKSVRSCQSAEKQKPNKKPGTTQRNNHTNWVQTDHESPNLD